MNGIIGHECINELIVDRLLNVLGIEHLSYQLIYADILIHDVPYTTWLCASEDFKEPGESKIALDAYYQLERTSNECPLDFCIRMGWSKYIWEMLVVDFLILNRDRHGANIEVLRNQKKRSLRLAPLFDHGLSLIFNCSDPEQVKSIDVMADKSAQCFVGSRSTWDNLKLIPISEHPNIMPLKKSHCEYLFQGLENALSTEHRKKIWEMIWKRWCAYETFRDKR